MFDQRAWDGILELVFASFFAVVFIVLSLIVGIFIDVTSQSHLIVGGCGAVIGYIFARRIA